MTTPIIKWAGGKTRLLPELLTRLPRWAPGRYFEPFAGGAALFFRLGPRNATLADANADLIAMYRSVQTDVEQVIKCLHQHKREHEVARTSVDGENTYYYRVRELWNNPRVSWLPSQHAAAFIYLNKTCFNGLWRVNSKGEFNVPAGKYNYHCTPHLAMNMRGTITVQ